MARRHIAPHDAVITAAQLETVSVQGIDGKARVQLMALSLSALEQQVAALPDEVTINLFGYCPSVHTWQNWLLYTKPCCKTLLPSCIAAWASRFCWLCASHA